MNLFGTKKGNFNEKLKYQCKGDKPVQTLFFLSLSGSYRLARKKMYLQQKCPSLIAKLKENNVLKYVK